ncbi:MAG: YegP family protein [bacterium]
MGKFEIFKSKEQWYFRLKAGNGEIIASSEGYNTKQGAMKGVASVQANASKADIIVIDKTEKTEMKKKTLKKIIIKTEKDYNNPKTDSKKTQQEKDDEQKLFVSGPISSWQKVGPRWM